MGVRAWIANNVAVRGGINEVTVTDTPASGEVLTATSSTAASWQPGGGGGGGAVDSVDGQTGDVDLSDVYVAKAGIVGVQMERNTAALAGAGHEVGWTAAWDITGNDELMAMPAEMGLSNALDGTSSFMVPTEDGVWVVDYSCIWAQDATAEVYSYLTCAADFPRPQSILYQVSDAAIAWRVTAGSSMYTLPFGSAGFGLFAYSQEETASPYDGPTYSAMKIIRLA